MRPSATEPIFFNNQMGFGESVGPFDKRTERRSRTPPMRNDRLPLEGFDDSFGLSPIASHSIRPSPQLKC